MAISARDIDTAIEAVALSLGYSHLKEEQKVVISGFVMGSDVFAILPTGFGKTLCYACLPNVFDKLYGVDNSVIVVISPLTSIMKTQV